MLKKLLLSFVIGFVSTLVFHQTAVFVLQLAGIIPGGAWNFAPKPPLGVPSVISLAFFGGLWGILSFYVMKMFSTKDPVLFSTQILFGGIFPTLVAMLVVFPMKGIEVVPAMYIIGFIVNAVWGLGMAVGFKVLGMDKRLSADM